MRLTRIQSSSKELDSQEHNWWNENSDLVESIWANSYEIQKVIREPYLNNMKKFFLDGSSKLPLKILEVGCGTGWVCRLVADETFHVIGTDFSESQINRAKAEAKRYGKEKYCQYELSDASTFTKNYDGVVIHALLHHLTTDELNVFFNEFSKLNKGTKVFMYEPVFFEPKNSTGIIEKIINRCIIVLKRFAFYKIEKQSPINQKLFDQWNNIFDLATKKGWYISPKEVPFYETEINDYLNKYCVVLNKYIVNNTDLAIAQKLTLHDIHKPGSLFTKFILPSVRLLEKQLFKCNFRPFIYKDQHLFVCFELSIK